MWKSRSKSKLAREARQTTKILLSKLKVAFINSFFLISSTNVIVEKALEIIYNLC